MFISPSLSAELAEKGDRLPLQRADRGTRPGPLCGDTQTENDFILPLLLFFRHVSDEKAEASCRENLLPGIILSLLPIHSAISNCA
jgi:hypothetical protein